MGLWERFNKNLLAIFHLKDRGGVKKGQGEDPAAAAAAKSRQSCLTLCDPIDGSPPGSPVSGILQARTLEWVAISFSNAWTWEVKVKSLSRVRLFETPWTAAHQAPPSMGFSRQEHWSGVPWPSPGWRSYFTWLVMISIPAINSCKSVHDNAIPKYRSRFHP